jgi:hypothetical protein
MKVVSDSETREASLKERLTTVGLLVLTSLDLTPFILKILFTYVTKCYLNEEVKCTEPSSLISVPWWNHFRAV